MADILRGPLFVSRREFSPVLQVASFTLPSLLATLLTVTVASPLQISSAEALTAQILRRPAINADSTCDTPKTLTVDRQAPVFVPPHFAPSATRVRGWLPADTSRSAAALIRAPVVVPSTDLTRAPLFVNRRYMRQYDVVDTSRGTASLLRDVVAGPPPVVVAPLVTPQRRWWQPADSTRGSAKPLFDDAQAPIAAALDSAPTRARDVVDTTQGMASLLRVVAAPAPFVPAPSITPMRRWWQPADATADTPKALTADAQAPLFVAPGFAPQRIAVHADTTADMAPVLRTVVAPAPFTPIATFAPLRVFWQPPDTTCDTPKSLTADAQAPVANLQHTPPDRVRVVVVESSQSTAKALYGDGVPALIPPPHIAPVRFWFQPDDTSSGTAKALVSDAQPPVSNLQHTAPDRVRPVTDTSQSAYGTTQLVVIIPLPPGGVAYVAAPRWVWTNGDTTLESPPVAIQGVAPAPPPPVVVDVSTSPQGKYDEALAQKVRDWWDAEEARKREKAGFPETKKKRAQPLPDATPEAKPETKRNPALDVAAAERALASLKPKHRVVPDPGVVLSDDEIAQLLLLLDDDDDET